MAEHYGLQDPSKIGEAFYAGHEAAIKRQNVNALQGLDITDPAQMTKAASALIGLGQASQIENLQNAALTGKVVSALGQPYVSPSQRKAQAAQATQSSAATPDSKLENQLDPQQAADFHKAAVMEANSIKAAGPEGSEQRQQAYQQAIQKYQNMGISPDVIQKELPDASDASINAAIVNHVGHAVSAINGTGAYAKTVSVPQTPDTTTYNATKDVAQDSNANPQLAQAIPAETATTTVEAAPEVSTASNDPTVVNPATGMSIEDALDWKSQDNQNRIALIRSKVPNYGAAQDAMADATLKPMQSEQGNRADFLSKTQEFTDSNGNKHQMTGAEFESLNKQFPGLLVAPSPDVQAARTTAATNAASPTEAYVYDQNGQVMFNGTPQRFTKQADRDALTSRGYTLSTQLPGAQQVPTLNPDGSQGGNVYATPGQVYNSTVGGNGGNQSGSQSNGNPYDTVVGFGQYGNPSTPISNMTIGGVIDFGRNTLIPNSQGKVGQGNLGSSASGAYQITQSTLQKYAPQVLGADWRNQPFNAANQDKIAQAIFNDNKNGDLTATWPSLPNSKSGAYANVPWSQMKNIIQQGEVGSGGNTSGGNSIRLGTASPTTQASAVADNTQYNDVRSKVTDQSYRSQLPTQIQTGLEIKGLASKYAQGPSTGALNKLASAVAPFVPGAQQHASDVTRLSQDLAQGTRQILSQGSGVRNEKEFETVTQGISGLNDPKQSIIYSGAMFAGAKQLEKAYSDALVAYDSDPKNQKKYSSFEQYWNSTPEGQFGVFGQPALQDVQIAGKPLITRGKIDGKPAIIVGVGLGKGNYQVIKGN